MGKRKLFFYPAGGMYNKKRSRQTHFMQLLHDKAIAYSNTKRDKQEWVTEHFLSEFPGGCYEVTSHDTEPVRCTDDKAYQLVSQKIRDKLKAIKKQKGIISGGGGASEAGGKKSASNNNDSSAAASFDKRAPRGELEKLIVSLRDEIESLRNIKELQRQKIDALEQLVVLHKHRKQERALQVLPAPPAGANQENANNANQEAQPETMDAAAAAAVMMDQGNAAVAAASNEAAA